MNGCEHIEVVLSKRELHEQVSQLCTSRTVDRSSLARWRAQLNRSEGPYTMSHARVLAYYGETLARGFGVDDAVRMAAEYASNIGV